MKELLNTLCTTSSLRLLLGENIEYAFPLKFPKSKEPKEMKIRKPVTLAKIVADTPHLNKSSFDERWDGKHPIEIAIGNLQYKGFTNAIKYKIYKNKASVKSKQIKGSYSFLAKFITDERKQEILDMLDRITYSDRNATFSRDGQVF